MMSHRLLAALLLAAPLALGTMATAGASESTSVLTTPYVGAAGKPASLSASCVPGSGTYTVAVHPWDERARSFQLFAADGRMVANVALPTWSGTYDVDDPDRPVRLRYAGTVHHDIDPAPCYPPAEHTVTTEAAPPVSEAPPTTMAVVEEAAPLEDEPVATPATVPEVEVLPESVELVPAQRVALGGQDVPVEPMSTTSLTTLPATGGDIGLAQGAAAAIALGSVALLVARQLRILRRQ